MSLEPSNSQPPTGIAPTIPLHQRKKPLINTKNITMNDPIIIPNVPSVSLFPFVDSYKKIKSHIGIIRHLLMIELLKTPDVGNNKERKEIHSLLNEIDIITQQ